MSLPVAADAFDGRDDEPSPTLPLYDVPRGNNPPALIGFYHVPSRSLITANGNPSHPTNPSGRPNGLHGRRFRAATVLSKASRTPKIKRKGKR